MVVFPTKFAENVNVYKILVLEYFIFDKTKSFIILGILFQNLNKMRSLYAVHYTRHGSTRVFLKKKNFFIKKDK